MLAHAGTPDEQVALLMIVGGLWVGWVGYSRLRQKGFSRVPVPAAVTLAVLGVAIIVGGLILPRQFLRPNQATATPAGPRPASSVTFIIRTPTPGEVVHGNQLDVVMSLPGGRIINTSSTNLSPNTGHIHISLDGRLVSMTYGLVQVVDLNGLDPGPHTLTAEFVAADHGPFNPRVVANVRFTKARSS